MHLHATFSFVVYNALLCTCFMMSNFIILRSCQWHLCCSIFLINLHRENGCWHSKILNWFLCNLNHESSIVENNYTLQCISLNNRMWNFVYVGGVYTQLWVHTSGYFFVTTLYIYFSETCIFSYINYLIFIVKFRLPYLCVSDLCVPMNITTKNLKIIFRHFSFFILWCLQSLSRMICRYLWVWHFVDTVWLSEINKMW